MQCTRVLGKKRDDDDDDDDDDDTKSPSCSGITWRQSEENEEKIAQMFFV